MPTRTGYAGGRTHADYMREWRARGGKGKGAGRAARWLDAPAWVAWDGEGKTVAEPSGLPTFAMYDAAVDAVAGRILEAEHLRQEPIRAALAEIGGKVIPGSYNGKRRGEFIDVPQRFLGPTDKRGEGNLDLFADHLRTFTHDPDLTTSDALDELRTLRKPTLKWAREEAQAELDHLKPRPGRHVYTLLANSRGEYIEDQGGLSTEACFDFMVRQGEAHGGARHGIFAGSYDANMILGDLTHEHALRVAAFGDEKGEIIPVAGRLWALTYRARRMLTVGEIGKPTFLKQGEKWKRNVVRKVTLWDVWGFFQGSFISALDAWLGDRVREVVPLFDEIARMKQLRASFHDEDPATIRDYCFAECRALEELLTMLSEALREAGLFPQRYDGAGAIAGALLKRESVKAAIEQPPEELQRAIACAYAGGRIEIPKLGDVGEAWDYDLRSAYPSALQDVPSLAGGRWVPTDRLDGFTIARVRWDFDAAPWYPLYFRRKSGAVQFPATGEGWYWAPEVKAAIAFAERMGGLVDVRAAWRLDPATDERPFGFIPDLYDHRRQLKRDKKAAEKVIKLAINSLYGKTAQQVGGSYHRPPPYFSLAWAGWTTSSTRAALVTAALADPEAVAMFATDGLFTTRPLGIEQPGDALGTWELAAHSSELVIAQAGVYWWRCPAGCKLHPDGGAWHARYRGFDKEGMESPDLVLDAWACGSRQIDVHVTRFVTLASALASEELWPFWRTWRTVPRRLDLSGRSAKRLPIGDRDRPDRGAVDLTPSWNVEHDAAGETSAPYRVAWWELPDEEWAEEVDGVPSHVFDQEAAEAAM